MDTEEELLREYQRNRANLEEQEDAVKQYIRNGENYTQDILGHVRQLIEKRSLSMEPFLQTQRELQRNEQNYLEELAQESRNLVQQQEEARTSRKIKIKNQ